VQRRIRGNHVAIVDMARGGPDCRIADGQDDDDDKPRGRAAMVARQSEGWKRREVEQPKADTLNDRPVGRWAAMERSAQRYRSRPSGGAR
jgi:hypothetical protein